GEEAAGRRRVAAVHQERGLGSRRQAVKPVCGRGLGRDVFVQLSYAPRSMSSADERMTQITKVAKSLRERFDWQKVRMFRLYVRTPEAGERQQEYAKRVLRVGSREGNDLVLEDATVSRIHFEITADAHRYRLRDLGSSN